MGVTRQQSARWAMRDKVRSPGRPPGWQRGQLQRFWAEIAKGVTSEDAAVSVGVASAVGTRWFRQAGGMHPSVSPRCSAVTCPWPSVRRSPSSRPKGAVCERLPAMSDAHRQPSAEHCDVTRPLVIRRGNSLAG